MIKADYSNIILDESVYNGEKPDLAFILAQEILEKRSLLP